MNEYLMSLGYSSEFKGHLGESRYWCKKIKKHQIVVSEWLCAGTNYAVAITWEGEDKIWAKNEFYGLDEDQLKKHLSRMENDLYCSALTMGANPENYRYEGDK
jgi:hypothetical protein